MASRSDAKQRHSASPQDGRITQGNLGLRVSLDGWSDHRNNLERGTSCSCALLPCFVLFCLNKAVFGGVMCSRKPERL